MPGLIGLVLAFSIYTFKRACWESRFYDEAYWARRHT